MSFEDNSTNWPIYTLDTVCTVTDCQHKTAPTVDYRTKFRMLRTTNIRNGRIILENAKYVTEEVYEAWSVRGKLEINDVILTREAPMGEVGIIKDLKEKLFLGQRMLQLKADKDKILPDFLYYSLLSPHLQRQIKVHEGTGSVVSNIRIPALKKFKFFVPGMNVQKLITQILRNIDDKIELNNAINKNLEEMAQALFRRWFIDFEFPNENGEPYKSSGGEFKDSELGLIPKGWKVSALSDVADILMGQSPKSEFYNEKGEGLPFHQGVTNYGYRYPSVNLYSSQLLRVASQGSILLSVRAPVGRINIANTDIVIGRGLGALNSKMDCNSYLFYLLKVLFMKEDQYGSGTIFNSITKKELENIKIIRPSNSIVKEYEKISSTIDGKILSLSKETDALIQTRDSLLPKLMSGEIRVPIEEQELTSSIE